MPCVLPVLSIKCSPWCSTPRRRPGDAAPGAGLCGGVLASFAVIGGALVALRATGSEIGWGFQLQSPVFVTLMIYLLFAVGLNLSGVFYDRLPDDRVGQQSGPARRLCGFVLHRRAGDGGRHAMHGAVHGRRDRLCDHPALVHFALVLEAIGLGWRYPISSLPSARRRARLLPKPGAWMLRLKQFLAFPVYGTAVWLMYVLSAAGRRVRHHRRPDAGLVLIAFCRLALRCLPGRTATLARHWASGVSATAVAGACALVGLIALVDDGTPSSAVPAAASPAAAAQGLHWQPFSEAEFDALRAEGKPVFIDFTAAWCITCKVNERIALADPVVTKAFADAGIAALEADWTRQDAGITRMLEANGRAGVPLYLFYPRRRPASQVAGRAAATADRRIGLARGTRGVTARGRPVAAGRGPAF